MVAVVTSPKALNAGKLLAVLNKLDSPVDLGGPANVLSVLRNEEVDRFCPVSGAFVGSVAVGFGSTTDCAVG